MEKENWDFDKTYVYVLKLMSRQACSRGKIKEKILAKTSRDVVEEVLQTIDDNNLLDDTEMCFDTALLNIQKKPISKMQMYQKLQNYRFNREDINLSLEKLENNFKVQGENSEESDFFYLGGVSQEVLKEYYKDLHLLTIWNVLALASCVQMIHNDRNLNTTKILRRLELRGFLINSQLRKLIRTMIENKNTE